MTNIDWLMQRVGVDSYDALHAWSAAHRAEYWRLAIERLGIRFRRPYREMLDLSAGVESPRWLVDARFNIVESCFSAAPDSPAIVHQAEVGPLRSMSVVELANGVLIRHQAGSYGLLVQILSIREILIGRFDPDLVAVGYCLGFDHLAGRGAPGVFQLDLHRVEVRLGLVDDLRGTQPGGL